MILSSSGGVGLGTTNTQTSNLYISGPCNVAILPNVGIGTTDTGTYRLNVVGSASISSNFYADASLLNNIELTQKIINKNANINLQDFYGNTPIMTAAFHGHTKIIINLLKINRLLSILNIIKPLLNKF